MSSYFFSGYAYDTTKKPSFWWRLQMQATREHAMEEKLLFQSSLLQSCSTDIAQITTRFYLRVNFLSAKHKHVFA